MNRYEFICECSHKWMGYDAGDSFCDKCGKYCNNVRRLNKGEKFEPISNTASWHSVKKGECDKL